MIRLRTATLGLAILAGSATIASAQSTTAPSTQAPAGKQGHGKQGHGKHGAGMGEMRERGMRAMFKDITLTADQQTRIKAIGDKYRPQRESLAESMRPAMNEARDARQRGDSAAAKAAIARTAENRTKLAALRDQQMSEIRSVLTPAQQPTFDRNVSQMKEKMEQHRARGGRKA